MIVKRLGRSGWPAAALSLLLLAVFLFPIYWMVATAVKPESEIFAYPPRFFPSSVDLGIWPRRIFSDPQIGRYFLNSLVVGIGTALLTLALAAPAAYGVAHLPIRGKPLFLLISLSSLMFPAVMLATPLFVIFNRLGLLNSYAGLIMANSALAVPFALVVLRPFFLSIPRQLAEAAKIDGCTSWGAFVRVMLPIAAPGLLTVAMFAFLGGWGDLVFALALLTDDRLRPVTAGLWLFQGHRFTEWNAVMALSSLAMLPPLAVFLLAQRSVVAGLTAGAVKE